MLGYALESEYGGKGPGKGALGLAHTCECTQGTLEHSKNT